MIINGNAKVGKARVYASKREMELESQIAKKDQIIAELKRLYFYGDKDNWFNGDCDTNEFQRIDSPLDSESGLTKNGEKYHVGGKLAREVAERVRGIEDGK